MLVVEQFRWVAPLPSYPNSWCSPASLCGKKEMRAKRGPAHILTPKVPHEVGTGQV